MKSLVERELKEIILNSIKFIKEKAIPIGISNRHIHLCKKDAELLFGEHYSLTPLKQLKQNGEYACKETIVLKGERGIIENVRILGPLREKTQVEILKSDIYKLGIDAPIRLSGDLCNSKGAILISNKNAIRIEEGVIIAKRHIHMNKSQAEIFSLRDKQKVDIQIKGERPVIFNDVIIRINNNYNLELHLDIDEANASGVKNGDFSWMIL